MRSTGTHFSDFPTSQELLRLTHKLCEVNGSEQRWASPSNSILSQRLIWRDTVERKVRCHTTITKEMPSILDGNQLLLIAGRIPQTRIPKSATPFPATRIPLCLRPNPGKILNGRSRTTEVRTEQRTSWRRISISHSD